MDSSTEKPPRARVEDAVDTEAEAPRTRDYLDGFLAAGKNVAVVGLPGHALHHLWIVAIGLDAGFQQIVAGLALAQGTQLTGHAERGISSEQLR